MRYGTIYLQHGYWVYVGCVWYVVRTSAAAAGLGTPVEATYVVIRHEFFPQLTYHSRESR